MNGSFSQDAQNHRVNHLHVSSPRPSSLVLPDSTRPMEVNCILLSMGQSNTRMNNASHTSVFVFGAKAPSGPWPPHSRGFYITDDDALQPAGLLWTSDQPVAETSTRQHTTLTTDKHPCPPPRWDSNPQSQQASGRRPTP